MSLFEGMGELELSAKGERYEKGSFDFASLVSQVTDYYHTNLLNPNRLTTPQSKQPSRTWFSAATEEIQQMVQSYEGASLDQGGFINAVIEKVAGSVESPDHAGKNLFLDALVQGLYNLGYNNFIVDVSGLDLLDGGIAGYLGGSEENVLRATYRGSVDVFGSRAEWCDLTLVGETRCGGDFAKHSALRFTGQVRQSIGTWGKDSTYHLTSLDPIGCDRMENCECHIYLPEESRFSSFIRYHRELKPKISDLDKKHFFRNGNTLFLHSGDRIREVKE